MLLNKVKPKKLSVTCHKFGNSRFTLNATFTIQELHKFFNYSPFPNLHSTQKKKKKSLTAIASGTKKKSDCHHTGSFSVALKGKKKRKKEKEKKKKTNCQLYLSK